MVRVDGKTLSNVRAALRDYRAEVKATNCTESTKRTYLVHAENFVRWMEGGFVPGRFVR